MPRNSSASGRQEAVWDALGEVLDPELDEPLTGLGFVHAVDVEGDRVTVTLRLPTYWCSANFAYIMGEDIIAAVGSLPWPSKVTCRLEDHFAARRLNDGLARGLSFREAFDTQAVADLDEVRADFKDKSFLGRQAILIQAMRREKIAPEEIVAITIGGLAERARHGGVEHARQIERYLDARRTRPAPCGPEDLAFLTIEGSPIAAAGLLDHLREARRIRGSFEANAELCRMLFAARYGDNPIPEHALAEHEKQDGEEVTL